MRTTHRSTGGRLAAASLLLTIATAPTMMAPSTASADSVEGAGPIEIPSQLASRLGRVVSSPALRGAKVGALVVRERDGKVLFEHHAERPLIPASNAKVLTSLAVLDALGPAHRFDTVVYADAAPDAAGSVGSLIVRGGGDPAVNSEDWWRLAAELRAGGLRRVRGDILLDDSALDRVRWHPKVKGISARAYHAPVGALNANYGSYAVTLRPAARAGEPALVEVNPPLEYLRVSNQAVTANAARRASLVVDRKAGQGNEIVEVRGAVRLGAESKTYYRSVLDPALYAGSVLRMQLEAVGIEVGGKLRMGGTPESAYELLRFEGRSLAEIVRLLMKYSNNSIAETLVKDLGAWATGESGSWQTGTTEMRRRLIALGLEPESFDLVDGSGLSYEDRIAPAALVKALRVARESFRFGPELLAALPIAARDGTLEKRAEDAQDRVRGKTGLLNQVTGLSGLAQVTGANGEPETAFFSILVNGYRGSDEQAMAAVDRFVAELSRAD